MGDHYYTTRTEALTTVRAQGYKYEGIAAHVLTAPIWGAVPLYALYHPSLANHHYTTNLKERDSLTAEHGWIDEGIACYVHETGREYPFGVVPLFHLYDNAQGDHFFTTVGKEREGATAVGYVEAGIACYVFPSPVPGATPLHRFYSSYEREQEEEDGFFGSLVNGVKKTITAAVDTVTGFGRTVINAAESTVGVVGDAVGGVFGVITAIPVLGRGIRQIQTLAATARGGVDFVLEITLGLFGIRPEKQMKLRVVIQMTPDQGLARSVPIVDEAVVRKGVQFAIDVFKSAANVRIVPLGRFRNGSGDGEMPTGGDDYIRYADGMSGNAGESLDVHCGSEAWQEDLATTGSDFEAMMTEYCFDGGARKVVGAGAPVCAFAVRSFRTPRKVGCSLGPLTDYVTVMFRGENGSEVDRSTLAHELGHACNLPHFDGGNNLMNENPDPDNPVQRRSLTRTQIALLRASRHVTYL